MADTITRTDVDSSTIRSIGYNHTTQILAIGFKSGPVFHYADVPVGVFESFLEAESPGRFYARTIKGTFSGQKMTGPCPSCGDPHGWIGEVCTVCGDAVYLDWPTRSVPTTGE